MRGEKMNFTQMMNAISKELNKKSEKQINLALTSKMANRIELWSSMFENRPFWLNKNIKSCNLSAAISSELARLVTLEFKSEISGSPKADFMQQAYKKVLTNLRQYTEFGCAKGGLIFKPYVTTQGISIQYIQADAFFPISFDDSGNITSCAFAEQLKRGQRIYTRIEIHELVGDKLTITNMAFASSSDAVLGSEISIQSVPEWSELKYQVTFSGVKKVPFGYFKVPLANADDPDSPLGCSVFARSVGHIRDADIRYSQIDWEYEAKEAAVHIAENMLQDDPNDKGKKVAPAHKDRLYRGLPFDTGVSDKPFIMDYSPEIRADPLFKGFNSILRLIEFNCNLAYGTLSDPQNVDKTAEEIKASKQRSYTFVSDTQMALQSALNDLVDAMSFYCTVYGLCPEGNYEVSYNWDDSIVVDAEKERETDRKDVAMGVMSLAEYRAKWYGETLEEAEKNIPEQADVMP